MLPKAKDASRPGAVDDAHCPALAAMFPPLRQFFVLLCGPEVLHHCSGIAVLSSNIPGRSRAGSMPISGRQPAGRVRRAELIRLRRASFRGMLPHPLAARPLRPHFSTSPLSRLRIDRPAARGGGRSPVAWSLIRDTGAKHCGGSRPCRGWQPGPSLKILEWQWLGATMHECTCAPEC